MYFVYFIPFVYLLRLLCDSPGVNLDTKAQSVLRVAVNFTHRGGSFSQIIWFCFMCPSGKEAIENAPAGEAHQGGSRGFWGSL